MDPVESVQNLFGFRLLLGGCGHGNDRALATGSVFRGYLFPLGGALLAQGIFGGFSFGHFFGLGFRLCFGLGLCFGFGLGFCSRLGLGFCFCLGFGIGLCFGLGLGFEFFLGRPRLLGGEEIFGFVCK